MKTATIEAPRHLLLMAAWALGGVIGWNIGRELRRRQRERRLR